MTTLNNELGHESDLSKPPLRPRRTSTIRRQCLSHEAAVSRFSSALNQRPSRVLLVLSLLLALTVPTLQYPGPRYNDHVEFDTTPRSAHLPRGQSPGLASRQASPTDTCTRWSHQTAIVNGTLYVYGGQAKESSDQNDNTWNNDLLSLPLQKTFQIGSPTLKGLPQPSGPPPVANGYLWNSFDSLFLYGGLFSDHPVTSPVPYSLWEYDISSSKWKEHDNPKTSAGNNSEPAGAPIQRAAEGAGLAIPELGRGYYFGGHLDGYTTPGWSQSVPRVYLKAMVEYTFPGYPNTGVPDLDGKGAPHDGAWRNITEGGLQDAAGFTERADGVLVYIPGWGKDGIIIGLAGGTNETYTQMNVIDIYDIANSTWYKQATSGETPGIRVNPCAVVAAAPDGSSFNVHLYGGQNLIPYGSQEQYDDMWILSIPSFTWIKVDVSGQANPPARAGHTCNIWDSQMVVVGGYVGKDLSCDSPGVYVFDLSELKWQSQFTALSGGNNQNQQPSQEKKPDGKQVTGAAGSSGSYGYRVPKAVQSVIGGNANGGATVTAPVQSATEGPLATGTAPTYTITGTGAVVTETGKAGQRTGTSNTNPAKSGRNKGAIIAGAIAGFLALVAGYLAFCAWAYRRQLQLYRNHVAMTHRASSGTAGSSGGYHGLEKPGYAGGLLPVSTSTSSAQGSHNRSGRDSGEASGGSSAYAGAGGLGFHGGSTESSTEDLIAGQEPSFLGVLLSPRRSLRVINRD